MKHHHRIATMVNDQMAALLLQSHYIVGLYHIKMSHIAAMPYQTNIPYIVVLK